MRGYDLRHRRGLHELRINIKYFPIHTGSRNFVQNWKGHVSPFIPLLTTVISREIYNPRSSPPSTGRLIPRLLYFALLGHKIRQRQVSSSTLRPFIGPVVCLNHKTLARDLDAINHAPVGAHSFEHVACFGLF